jgi:hypothetical protein
VSNDGTTLTFTVAGTGLNTKSQLFIALDSEARGYRYTWPTADIKFLVENTTLYAYSGSGSSWSWARVSAVTVAKSATSVSIQVPLAAIGVAPGATVRLGFITADKTAAAYPPKTEQLVSYLLQ